MQTSASASENLVVSGSRQYTTFHVDNLFFGVDVLRVQEVLRYQEMTRIPLAPPVVRGLINLRGQIVTAIDMRCRLGLEAREDPSLIMNIVVRLGEEAVSLLVDEIGDVVEVEAELFEPRPDNVDAEIKELIRGIYKLKDKLLLVLDIGKTVATVANESRGVRR